MQLRAGLVNFTPLSSHTYLQALYKLLPADFVISMITRISDLCMGAPRKGQGGSRDPLYFDKIFPISLPLHLE